MKKLLIAVLIFLAMFILFFSWRKQGEMPVSLEEKKNGVDIQLNQSGQIIEEKQEIPVVMTAPENIAKKILQDVPFTSQAPTGNWKDLIFQNACEEASLLMADAWVSGKVFGSVEEESQEIRRITKEERKYFPKDAYDLSAEDMVFLAGKRYPAMIVSLIKNVTKESLKNTILGGDIIIVPANGQKLRNPNFTAPGPLYHTLLIRGYDHVSDEFIVNDPGTRKGDAYRYTSDILFDAMQDYETGYHGKIFPDEKVMLVIAKK